MDYAAAMRAPRRPSAGSGWWPDVNNHGLHLGHVLPDEGAVRLDGETQRERCLGCVNRRRTVVRIDQNVAHELAGESPERLLAELRPTITFARLGRIQRPLVPGTAQQMLEQVLDLLEDEQVSADATQDLVDLRLAGVFGAISQDGAWLAVHRHRPRLFRCPSWPWWSFADFKAEVEYNKYCIF
ncbi:MAG TPA: hypothetical protein PK306_12650 [Aquabacterium sp.]|nr:hypothetical protein [Aquabacterium sp.]